MLNCNVLVGMFCSCGDVAMSPVAIKAGVVWHAEDWEDGKHTHDQDVSGHPHHHTSEFKSASRRWSDDA